MRTFLVKIELHQPARSKLEAEERVYIRFLKPLELSRKCIKEVKQAKE